MTAEVKKNEDGGAGGDVLLGEFPFTPESSGCFDT